MFEALKDLGEMCGDQYKYCDIPYRSMSDKNIIFTIKLIKDEVNGHYTYDGTEIGDYDLDNYYKYFYRPIKAGKSSDYAPGGKVGSTFIKTLENKVYGWFKAEFYNEEILEMVKVNGVVYNYLKGIKKVTGVNYFITVTINGLYPYEYEPIRERAIAKIMTKRGKASGEGQCMICYKHTTVCGNYAPFAVYSLDKMCYVNGLMDEDAWKNFPVCHDCCDNMLQGKKIMEKHLYFRLGGLPYYLIPRSIFNHGKTIKHLLNAYKNLEEKRQNNKELDRMAFTEEFDVLSLMCDENDACTLNFMFSEALQSKYLVSLYLEDTSPSRIMEIVNARKKVEDMDLIKRYKLKFNFSNLRKLCYYIEEKAKQSEVLYMDIISKIFRSETIDRGRLIVMAERKLVKAFKKSYKENDDTYLWETLKAFCSLEFLYELGVIKNEEEANMTITVNVPLAEKVQQFLNERNRCLYSTEAASVFLMGVLCRKLTKVQMGRSEEFKAPFLKYLKGFRMSEKDVKELFSKMVDKFMKYDENYYQQLQAIISDLMTQSKGDWDMPNYEVNYFFLLGYTLGTSEVFDTNGKKEITEEANNNESSK